MKVYDAALDIEEGTPNYPGTPPFESEELIQGGYSLRRLCLSSHTGTHVDAPTHLLERGSLDEVPLKSLVGPATVVDLTGVDEQIEPGDLGGMDLEPRVLMKTRNSELLRRDGFVEDYVHLAPEGAKHLAERGVSAVGIDYLSIEEFDGDGEVHRILLERGIPIVESLDLSGIAAGDYLMVCRPLPVGGDGAPATCVLIEGSGPP